jgi:hypothetical protein
VFRRLSSSNQNNAVTNISEIAIKIAQYLLPKDTDKDASTLLRRMTENPKFGYFTLPNSDETKPNSYDEWTANSVVATTKSALTKLGFATSSCASNFCRFLVTIQRAGLEGALWRRASVCE